MALIQPKSTTELLYFSNRVDGNQRIKAWVYKKDCPSCKKAKMGKPLDPKTGKVKIRSTEYICPSCGYSEEKKKHEESCMLEASYTCGSCGKEGEGTTPYKRKTYMGVPSYIIECQHCGVKLAITKKMKALKPKKSKIKAEDEDVDVDV
jgi:C4-type Zn-finger protein